MMRIRLSPVGRIVLGVVIALLVASYVLRLVNAGAVTPFLFLIAAAVVVAVIVFSVARRFKSRP